MKLLRYFNHENIISILDIQKPRNYETFTEVYLIQVCSPRISQHSTVANTARRNSWRKLDEDAYAVVKVGSKSVLVSSSSERLYGKHCSQNSKRVLRALVKRHCVRH